MPRRATKKSRKIARYIDEIRACPEPRPVPDPLGSWLLRYHEQISDYLVEHLDGLAEYRCWRIAYTALHQLLGSVFNQPGLEKSVDDDALWTTFDPTYFAHVHFPLLTPFSFLPDDFSPRGFEHHYAGFIRFLARRGVMTADHAEALVVLLHHALWEHLEVGAA